MPRRKQWVKDVPQGTSLAVDNYFQQGGCWPFSRVNSSYPEANIQGEFYYWCRVLGISCCLEMHSPIGRFDIVVMDQSCTMALAIVECKNPTRPINRHSRQVKRYLSSGVPVYSIGRLEDVEFMVRQIQKSPFQGVSLKLISEMPRFKRRNPRRNRITRIINDLEPEINYKT